MSWQDLGAIGDLVGGIAVVVSLIYVAFQIRQNSRQIEQNSRHVEASMYHATNDAFYRWFALLAQDAPLSALWGRALAGEDLDGDELIRVHSLIAMLFLSFENNFQQFRLGAVSRNPFEISRTDIIALMSRPVVQAWWRRRGARLLTPSFRAAIEALVAQARGAASAAAADAEEAAEPPGASAER